MMACLDNSKVLKEGVLHRYEKTQSRFLKQENWKTKSYYAELLQQSTTFKSLVCCLYTCKDNQKSSELKDKIELTNPHQVSTSSSIGVEKHKYDSYICITPSSGSTVFLSFKNNSERNEWYETIVSALRSLHIPTSAESESTPHRQRVGTEPSQVLIGKRRNSPPTPRDAVSSPAAGVQGFGKVLDEMKDKVKTNKDEDSQASKAKEINPCCVRTHLVAYHHDGTNMVYHPETNYENIHFVKSEDDWHREIQAKQDTVKLHKNVYQDFHNLTVIQSPQPTEEGPKWPRKQRMPSFTNPPAQEESANSPVEIDEHQYQNCRRHGRRSPVENDDRYPNSPPNSHLGYMRMNPAESSFQHPSPPPPALPVQNRNRSTSMRNRPLPPVPNVENEDVAKVKTSFNRRPSNAPSNAYVPSPSRQQADHPPKRPSPPLPPQKGEKLKRSQQCLRDEMMHPNGVTKDFPKTEVVGEKFALVAFNDNLIIAGWEPNNSTLTNALHIGDKLTMVNQQMLSSAEFAHETMKLTVKDEVTLGLQRIPYGHLISLHKEQPGQTLGVEVKGNQITLIHPHGLAAQQGNIRPQTPGITNPGVLCNWAITEINMRPVGLNATTQQVEKMLHNAGADVSLILHPIDFIEVLREALADKDRRYSFS